MMYMDNEIENDGRKNSTEVDTKEENTDESDEKNENTTEPRRKLNLKTYLRTVTHVKILKKKKMILN